MENWSRTANLEDVIAVAEKHRYQLALGTLSHISIIIAALHIKLLGF